MICSRDRDVTNPAVVHVALRWSQALDQPRRSLAHRAPSARRKSAGYIILELDKTRAPMIGSTLGHYRIEEELGAGGMGVVYRARDSVLRREVAVKVLTSAFASDAERLSRFEREAQLLASLTHPNVGAIHGMEEAGSVRYLVLELVPGETLAERLAQGPLPIVETLDVCGQIAQALEAAHEHGIIHRDLKPANIKITPEGKVKVLDFGLAKAFTGSTSAPDLSHSPTVTLEGTREGVILGTAAYMSPEQARGKALDKRTDIWSFGCVLYEMLTGRAAFSADTLSDTLAAILERQPDWSLLPPATSPRIRRLLERCLDKDVKRRLRDIGEARIGMEEGFPARDAAVPPRPAVVRRQTATVVAWVVAAVAVVVTITTTVLPLRRISPDAPLLRLDVVTPTTADPFSFAVSPDGQQLVFVATGEKGSQLWLRPLDRTLAQPLMGTEGASYPFWAPDNRALGFFAEGKLKRIDLGGGMPQVLADAATGRGGTWSRDGVILFSISTTMPLFRIAAEGGEATAVTRIDPTASSHRFPDFLPDGRQFIFWAGLGPLATQGVYLGSLDGAAPKRLVAAETAAAYAPPGYLLMVEQGVLVARPVDLTHGQVGESIPLAHAVGSDQAARRGAFSVSETGVLAHRAGTAGRRQLVWVDRAGTQVDTFGPPDESALQNPALAPNGRRAAVQRTAQGNFDIWMLEMGRIVPTRLTFDPGIDGTPVWSPDGSRVVFCSTKTGLYDLYEKLASGAGAERLLLASTQNKIPVDWSPDGRFVLYQTYSPSGVDLWALPVTGDRKPFPVVDTVFRERNGQFSPDGRWVAYDSNESGRFEVYVQPFTGPGGKWQVSSGGGVAPRWRHDGREMFYIAPDGALMAALVRAATDRQTLEPGVPARLFRAPILGGGSPSENMKQQYEVAPDGQRFLVNVTVDEPSPSPITIVSNWTAGLRLRR